MPKPQTIGIFAHNPQDVSDQPLWVMGAEIPESFLNEEIAYGKTVSESFFTSDLANMWCDVVFMNAMLKHPEAIRPIKEAAKRRNIKVQPISITKCLNLLEVTNEYLWENNIETVEDLVTKIARHVAEQPSEIVKNDLDSAFRSIYGISLLSIA